MLSTVYAACAMLLPSLPSSLRSHSRRHSALRRNFRSSDTLDGNALGTVGSRAVGSLI